MLSAVRIKNDFPPAVHLEGYAGHSVKYQNYGQWPLYMTAGGKIFLKHFALTLAVTGPSFNHRSQLHVRKSHSKQKVVISPLTSQTSNLFNFNILKYQQVCINTISFRKLLTQFLLRKVRQ